MLCGVPLRGVAASNSSQQFQPDFNFFLSMQSSKGAKEINLRVINLLGSSKLREEHEDLLQNVISEHKTLKRIQELKATEPQSESLLVGVMFPYQVRHHSMRPNFDVHVEGEMAA